MTPCDGVARFPARSASRRGADPPQAARDDRIIGVDVAALKTEMAIESPAPGVRGLAVHEGLRRGFFTAEFGNVMLSFDLDRFEIRKKITGFSVRPEWR